MTEDYFWGLTLDKSNATDVWDPDMKADVAEGVPSGFRGEHTLLVKQALLGPDAVEGETNVIEVEAMGYKSDVKFPISVLKKGTNQHVPLDILFPDPPVTFKLVQGSGPVILLGNHSVGSNEGMGDDEDEMEDDFDEEEDIEEPAENPLNDKKRKGQAAVQNHMQNKKAKKAKNGDMDE